VITDAHSELNGPAVGSIFTRFIQASTVVIISTIRLQCDGTLCYERYDHCTISTNSYDWQFVF